MSSPVRVRFAPSPTGYLHVGGARTALYNYLYAKKHGGIFILRIEDTDEARSTEESLRMQIGDLQWLGLKWDEGPDAVTLKDVGGKGPYRQSQRKSIYHEYAQQLVNEGKAYYCFMTEQEIDEQREKLKAKGLPPHVKSPFRNEPLEKARVRMEAGEKPVIRFKIPEGKSDYIHKDLVRGEVRFPSDMIGDFVLVRAGGMPVYNFVCALDDALMEITHVFRAEEHLNNTLRQLMIYEALGFTPPQFGHLSIILGADRQKLSKRHGATSCYDYKERGYLPEALNNFIALMGWSHPDGIEVMCIQEMIEKFSENRLNPAAAVFDEKKLLWMNATHLRSLSHKDLWKRLTPLFLKEGLQLNEDPQWQDRALSLFKTSMETLNDAVELFRPLSKTGFEISEDGKETLSWETSRGVVEKWRSIVDAHSGNFLSEEEFTQAQETIKNECSVKGKHLFMPIRVAIIGKPHGAELKILVPLMDKATLLDRADKALGYCK